MELLKSIFGRLGMRSRKVSEPPVTTRATAAPSPVPDVIVSTSLAEKPVKPVRLPSKFDDLVEMGQVSHSRNRQWSVGIGGVKAGRTGVQLRHNESREIRAVVDSLAKPFRALVSDVGIFAVDDGRPNALHADLIVFDATGAELYRRVYEANLFGFGISADGRYLACETANAGNSDGYIFEIHDVVRKCVLASRRPVTGYCDEFDFEVVDGKLTKVFVKLQKLGKFAYSVTGEFLDEQKYLTARLNKGNYAVRIGAAGELLQKDQSDKAVKQAFDALDKAIEEATEDAGWRASAFRLKAETLESQGDLDGAIKAYRMALDANPKVGVKKKVLALERRILQEASAPKDLFSGEPGMQADKDAGSAQASS